MLRKRASLLVFLTLAFAFRQMATLPCVARHSRKITISFNFLLEGDQINKRKPNGY